MDGQKGDGQAMFFFWKDDELWTTKTGKTSQGIAGVSGFGGLWTSFCLSSRDFLPLQTLYIFAS